MFYPNKGFWVAADFPISLSKISQINLISTLLNVILKDLKKSIIGGYPIIFQDPQTTQVVEAAKVIINEKRFNVKKI
ncbi:hypothetical protein MM213_20015 [Belliella sp. R4-6]|uniref:Uncharacterized protein n=1 Tax=Belliella alkalica TaxID=1730871 RepID=A0ABS9VH86_9BACT|nr:hypothetical protein [Belliella alkalica]MCH7415798.1 hypothetical protein [Belliella alkalica]